MILPAAVALLALSLFTSTGVADDTNAAAADLKALVTKVRTKLQEGKKTEADLAPELKEFDTLLDKYKGEQTDDVAQILQMKAMLYQQVLKDTEKGDGIGTGIRGDDLVRDGDVVFPDRLACGRDFDDVPFRVGADQRIPIR